MRNCIDYKSYIPEDADKVTYHEYVLSNEKRYNYLSGTYTAHDRFRCPKCDAIHKGLNHGQSLTCSCQLTMVLFGNALYCWVE